MSDIVDELREIATCNARSLAAQEPMDLITAREVGAMILSHLEDIGVTGRDAAHVANNVAAGLKGKVIAW